MSDFPNRSVLAKKKRAIAHFQNERMPNPGLILVLAVALIYAGTVSNIGELLRRAEARAHPPDFCVGKRTLLAHDGLL